MLFRRFATWVATFSFDAYWFKGIRHASEGDLQKGREYFRAAVLQKPSRGDAWANIGLTIHDQCKPYLVDGSDESKVKRYSVCAYKQGALIV